MTEGDHRLRAGSGLVFPLVSGAVLAREAARTTRQWQTYAARALFSGGLLGTLLLGMWGAVGTARSGIGDAADLAWIGRALFAGFAVVLVGLSVAVAPLAAAGAVIEEMDERTMDMLVLTPLRPLQIFAAKVLSRVVLLLTGVLGTAPVLALVINLGGVSTDEVVAVIVHTVTAVVLTASLGAFFALFTRSPALATLASAAYALPFFVLLPLAYVMATKDLSDLSQFSLFGAFTAKDLGSLLAPLGYTPALVVVLGLAAPLFRLRVSNADTRHAFSDDLWRTAIWLRIAVGFAALAMTSGPLAGVVAWTLADAGPKRPIEVVIGSAVLVWLWLLFTGMTALGTWAYLRVGADVVDGLDGLLATGFGGPRAARGSDGVWQNPVVWREARPRAWFASVTPILVTWGLAMLAVLQTGWWILPGGMLVVGAANAAAAIGFGAWLGARTVATERLGGTLELLLTTTLAPRDIVFGKFLGAALPTLPLLLVALPLLALGIPQLSMPLPFLGDPSQRPSFLGLSIWVWVVPVWVLAMGAAATAAARLPRAQTAFPTVLAGLAIGLVVPAVVVRALPSSPAVGTLCRWVSPALAGGTWVDLAVSTLGYALAAAAVWAFLAGRLRRWVQLALPLVLLAAAGRAEAAAPDPETIARLEAESRIHLSVHPFADGIVREGVMSFLTVRIENDGPGSTGVLSVVARDPDGVRTLSYQRPVDLAEGARKEVALPFAPGLGGDDEGLELTLADGRRAVAAFRLQRVAREVVTIAVVGDDPLGLPAALPQATEAPVAGRTHRHPAASPRAVRVGLSPPTELPTLSAGLGAVDWLVWPAADPSRATAEQLAALRAWVADGGNVLLTVSDTWRLVADSPLAAWLPVTLTGVDEAPIGGFLTRLGAAEGPAVPAARASLAAERSPTVRATTASGAPLWVSAAYGLGSVHVVLTDLRPHIRGQERAWRTLLTLPNAGDAPADLLAVEGGAVARAVRAMLHVDPVSLPDTSGDVDPATAFEAAIRKRLSAIPGVAPLPMSWLLGFAAVYLLAIGPVDYALLRLFRRPLLAWLTFPTWVVAFTGASLAMTSYTKGSQAMVVRVEVVDLLPDAGLARGATWVGLFATRRTELLLTSGFADGVVRPLTVAGFQTNPAVVAGSGPGALRYGAQTWTLAYARSDWTGPSPGTLELLEGPGGLEVHNGLGFDLEDAVVQIPDTSGALGWVRVGPVRAGGRVPLDTPLVPGPTLAGGDLGWVQEHFGADTHLERGSLDVEHRPLLLGIGRAKVEPLVIDGLEPVEQVLTVVRAPVASERLGGGT